ncbi:hypothetical protein HDF15_004533 [Granulicella mallensis]|uniref:Uncharacterized protein n=1 Tax=Granulicella mallensis TaxID=940614 RepID=A0A7W7ZU16_9BACT|nr:hypothetical protein [Granulicella mallensis]
MISLSNRAETTVVVYITWLTSDGRHVGDGDGPWGPYEIASQTVKLVDEMNENTVNIYLLTATATDPDDPYNFHIYGNSSLDIRAEGPSGEDFDPNTVQVYYDTGAPVPCLNHNWGHE